MGKLYR